MYLTCVFFQTSCAINNILIMGEKMDKTDSINNIGYGVAIFGTFV
jgi:hypothetical protein